MSRRLVVALVSDSIHPYHHGGKELRYHEMARRLARDADVHVYTMNWWRGERVMRDGDVTYHALCDVVPMYDGSRRSLRQAVVFAIACLRLLRERFDVIEADHMPYLQLFSLRLVASMRRRRLLVAWHEVWGGRYWSGYLGRVGGTVAWWIERAAMGLPHEIIATSEETARRLERHVGGRTHITVGSMGVDVDAIERAPTAERATTLVAVGRLISHKRIHLLIDAVRLLRIQGRDVTCRIIGDGPERERLRQRATEAGVAAAIEFRHDVRDQPALYALMKAARIFVFPSEREGFGAAALEALACGLPVVTTSAPDNLAADLVRDSRGGIVCDPDAASIARAIATILDTPGGVGAIDSDWLRRHDWQAVADRLMARAVA